MEQWNQQQNKNSLFSGRGRMSQLVVGNGFDMNGMERK
jgi:hypothetical protein